MNKIRVFESFSGYGSQSMALRNIGVDYEVVGISEIDKYAIKAYESTHGDVNNLGDISKIKVEDVPEHDLFTYSFCCQDVSVAGKQKGIKRGETRSGLLYECERIIEHCKPKYLLLENVKNLVGKKFKPQFDEWLKYLEDLGYTNYWQVLNAKDYGVPQNRERVFVVSILGEHKPYKFPSPIKLNKKIKDVLEDNVAKKYYLSEEVPNTLTTVQKDNYVLEINRIIKVDIPQIVKKRKYEVDIEKLKNTLKERKIKSKLSNKEISQILNKPLTLVEHWFRSDSSFSIPSEDIWFELKKVLSIETNEFDESITTFEEKEGVYEKSNRCYFSEGIAPTLTCGCNEKIIDSELKIRKLTPRECFRLMGVSEEDIDKIQAAGISETQQYKMAGNSIVVPVLEGIFRELFL